MDLRTAFESWAGMPPGSMLGWRFVEYAPAGQVQAVAAIQGTEIHFAVAPERRHRVIARQRTRDFLRPIFDSIGFLTTRVVRGDARADFVRRLGFVPTWSDDTMDHFMMTELPFGRKD